MTAAEREAQRAIHIDAAKLYLRAYEARDVLGRVIYIFEADGTEYEIDAFDAASLGRRLLRGDSDAYQAWTAVTEIHPHI